MIIFQNICNIKVMDKIKLLLFTSSKSKDKYIEKEYGFSTVNTTNIKTIYSFFTELKNKFILGVENKIIDDDTAVIYMESALSKYLKDNIKSIFKNQPNTFELAKNIYLLYKELFLSRLLEKNIIQDINTETINEVKTIISIYKKDINEKNIIDSNECYKLFLESIKEKKTIVEYDSIEIYGFENIINYYGLFLKYIKDYQNAKIKVILPYNISYLEKYGNTKIFFSMLNSFKTEVKENLNNFAKGLIEQNYEDLKAYRDNIYFLAGFGVKQEIDNVLDTVKKLVDSGTPLYEIAIISDDSEKYHDLLIVSLNEYKIPYDEKKGIPLWKSPLISIVTSVFNIINNNEIDVQTLVKILSSPYIKIKDIKSSSIRKYIFSKEYFRCYEKMPLSKFINRLKRESLKEEMKKTADSIIYFLEFINNIHKAKTFKTITMAYLDILKFLDILNTIKLFEDETIKLRDYKAYKIFLETLLKLSDNEENVKTENYHKFLNDMLRSLSIENYKSEEEKNITVSYIYDMRGINYKHMFFLGMNGMFLKRIPNTFILNEEKRKYLNEKYMRYIIDSEETLSISSRALFINILSNLETYSNLYLSFQYKDDDGNILLSSPYIEEIFFTVTNKLFSLKNLMDEGLIFRKEYFANKENIKTEKENMISLFYYQESQLPLSENTKKIINSVYEVYQKNNTNSELINESEETLKISDYILKKEMSVSDVESLIICPRSFIDSILTSESIEETQTIGIKRVDKGVLYHDAFRLFFEQTNKKYGIKELKKENIKDCKQIIFEITENIKNSPRYKIYDEEETDVQTLQEEMNNVLNIFVKKEIERNESSENIYIPSIFEHPFNSHTIYQNENNYSVKIKGRIDRIDLLYKDSYQNEIKGIRIVDYKSSLPDILSSSKKSENMKNIDIISNFLQPVLYLDYYLKHLEKNGHKIENLEIAYSAYKETSIKSGDYFKSFNNTEKLMYILKSIENKEIKETNNEENINLNTYISNTFDKLSSGIIEYKPSKDICKNCQKNKRCTYAILDN